MDRIDGAILSRFLRDRKTDPYWSMHYTLKFIKFSAPSLARDTLDTGHSVFKRGVSGGVSGGKGGRGRDPIFHEGG